MSTVITTSVLPDSTANDTLTFGATGDSVAISGDSLNLNTLQDAGGNTIFVSDGSGSLTSTGKFPGALNLIQTQTVGSAVTQVEFTTGLDSTYDAYQFRWTNVKMTSNVKSIGFQVSTDGGSSYASTCTTAVYATAHANDNSVARVQYESGYDIANATSRIYLSKEVKDDADANICGLLNIFNVHSTTVEKVFYSTGQVGPTSATMADTFYVNGYFTTTSAINALVFWDPESATTIAAGTFKMYGLSKS